MDWKGISIFLLITFGITYAVETALILSGISPIVKGLGQYAVVAVMWVPALAALLTIRLVTHEGFGLLHIRIGGWRPYVSAGLAVPGCFILIYGLTWMLGLGRPDWTMLYFKGQFAAVGAKAPDIPPPQIIWPVLFGVTLVVAPFFNSVLAFGEEMGWRGYLLPKLMPLGKFRAYGLLGMIWGLWHWPLVLAGFMYPGAPLAGVLMFTALTIALGIYINELTLRHRSCVLAGWIHGVFNTQRLGVWALLFPRVHPWLGGFSGLPGIGIWILLGLWVYRRGSSMEKGMQPGP